MPYRLLKTVGLGTKLWLVTGVVWLVDRALGLGLVPVHDGAAATLSVAESYYVGFAVAVALIGVPYGYMRRRTATARSCDGEGQRLAEVIGRGDRRPGPNASLVDRVLMRLPGNQVWSVEQVRREIGIVDLPPALDGMTIVHVSDLHFTGRVDRSYFTRVVEMINRLEPDVIAITGDVVDRADCLSWIPATLGRLRSRHGSFFVLGNHDGRVGHELVRTHLREAGLWDVGGVCRRVNICGASLLVAGNELPWCAPAADPHTFATDNDAPVALKMLLSHSGDQFRWARRHGFELMLAGHSHGGQIRLPGLGALVCPIRDSLAMAAGLFYEPPTMLHVSRGISAELPIRINCRPEITQLVLRPAPVENPDADAATDGTQPIGEDRRDQTVAV